MYSFQRIFGIKNPRFNANFILTLALFFGLSSSLPAEASSWPFVYPTPVLRKINAGEFIITPETKIIPDDLSISNALLIRNEIKQWLEIDLEVSTGLGRIKKPNSILLHMTDGRSDFKEIQEPALREPFRLSVNEKSISLSSSRLEGQLYGLMTLFQLVIPNTLIIPGIDILDWPKMPFRGLRGHFPRNDPEEIENFKRIVRVMAFCRLNQLWIRDLYVRRFPASLQLESLPDIGGEDALPKSVAKALIEYAEKYNVKVMGSLAATADNVWSIYPNLIEMHRGESPFTVKIRAEKKKGRTEKYRFGSRFNFCPSREKTYSLLFDLIDEMAPLFTSRFFDLGIDEVDQDYNGSRWVACELCRGKDPVTLFADYVNRLADYVLSKGKIPLVNSTPFINAHAGAFHDMYKALPLLRKEIIISNWSEAHVR
ncbi:MAG: family 20 glycosylhydrolase, partial [Candidatus Hodarchaeales archaeon]